MRTGFVEIGQLRLRIACQGEGPPLLLINGLGAPLEMWEPLVRELDGFEVIVFDLPGCGLSSTPRCPLGMRALAAIVDELLSALERPRAHVLGYSLGGLVAQELAHRHPDRVERLVLCATTPGLFSVPPHPLAWWLMLTPSRYQSATAARMIVPLMAGGRISREEELLDAHLPLRLSHAPTVLGYLHQLYAASGFTSHGWLRGLRHPTLVIVGNDDPVVPVLNARYLAHMIPDARLHVIHGAGHLLLLDETKVASRLIASFLAA